MTLIDTLRTLLAHDPGLAELVEDVRRLSCGGSIDTDDPATVGVLAALARRVDGAPWLFAAYSDGWQGLAGPWRILHRLDGVGSALGGRTEGLAWARLLTEQAAETQAKELPDEALAAHGRTPAMAREAMRRSNARRQGAP